jgi:phage terminase small subunit
LQRLVEEAEADLADLYTDAGDLKPVDQWPEIWRQGLVAGVEIEALFDGIGKDRKQIGYVKKLRLSDRVRRLELIGKHINVNAFHEQVKVTGLDALADRLDRARRIRDADEAERNARVASNTSSASRVEPANSTPAPIAPPPPAPAVPPPVAPLPPSAPSPPPPAPADWDAPARAYSPILPWPERPAFADCDYENFESGLVGSHKPENERP